MDTLTFTKESRISSGEKTAYLTNGAEKRKPLGQPLWRTVWRFLKKLEIELPYNPAIPLLGIHAKDTRIEKDMCTFNVHRSTVYNS